MTDQEKLDALKHIILQFKSGKSWYEIEEADAEILEWAYECCWKYIELAG